LQYVWKEYFVEAFRYNIVIYGNTTDVVCIPYITDRVAVPSTIVEIAESLKPYGKDLHVITGAKMDKTKFRCPWIKLDTIYNRKIDVTEDSAAVGSAPTSYAFLNLFFKDTTGANISIKYMLEMEFKVQMFSRADVGNS